MRAEPKATASFTYFQLHAQFHDIFLRVMATVCRTVFELVAGRVNKPRHAPRDSHLPIGCLRSVVSDHAFGAQILEIPTPGVPPCRFAAQRIRKRQGISIRTRNRSAGGLFIGCLRRTESVISSPWPKKNSLRISTIQCGF